MPNDLNHPITAGTVGEQATHLFSCRQFHFDYDREPRPSDAGLVRSIEIDPASMVPQPGGDVPFPGTIRLHFMTHAPVSARTRIRAELLKAIPGTLGGSDCDPWFRLIPHSGVITHQTVRDTLTTLVNNGAVAPSNAIRASQTIGISPAHAKRVIEERTVKGPPQIGG